jgi:hypothetical protein
MLQKKRSAPCNSRSALLKCAGDDHIGEIKVHPYLGRYIEAEIGEPAIEQPFRQTQSAKESTIGFDKWLKLAH